MVFSLSAFVNLELLTVGVVIAFMAVLGAVVYFSNTKSNSNTIFLFFCFTSIVWSVLNYLFYQTQNADTAFWIIRGVITSAAWFVFSLFLFLSTFPEHKIPFKKTTQIWLFLCAFGISILNLSPLVFARIGTLTPDGSISTIINGPGIVIFGIFVFLCLAGGLMRFISKFRQTKTQERTPMYIILAGIVITFALLITFNFILPAFFDNPSFLKFGALFIFPFIFGASLALLRYKFLNAKAAAVAILTAFLAVVIFGEIIFSKETHLLIFRISEFLLVLSFGILLIRGVTKEVEQREHIEILAADLRVANDKLKELDRLKSQFLSMASHDLRAPLTIIRNFISLLLDGSYGKLAPAGQEGLQQVFDRATDMAKSVETYLDVSRIEQGRMKYDFVDIELVPLIKNAVMAFTPNAEKKGLKLSATYDPVLDGIKAKIDVSKMNEVLNNLLDNTIKYTPTGEMNLSVKRIGAVARISLKDTGVGMTEDTLKNLFQLFRPGEDSKRINPASTGVGLFVTKAHVEAHGGKIWAESEGANKGSTFIIELPLLG